MSIARPTGTRLVEAAPRHFQRLLALIELFLPVMLIGLEFRFVVMPVVAAILVLVAAALTIQVPILHNILLPDTHRCKPLPPLLPVIRP